jgi:hypothetical protein
MWYHNPEDLDLHLRSCENLKSKISGVFDLFVNKLSILNGKCKVVLAPKHHAVKT